MSLSSSYRTEIVIPQPQIQATRANIKGVPCADILRTALEKIASEHGGSVKEAYRDCHGVNRPCVMAIETPELPNGLGVLVGDDGRVQFEYDRQNANASVAESLCNDIARAYSTIAVMRIQQNTLGFRARVTEDKPAANGRRVKTSAVRS